MASYVPSIEHGRIRLSCLREQGHERSANLCVNAHIARAQGHLHTVSFLLREACQPGSVEHNGLLPPRRLHVRPTRDGVEQDV